MRTRNHRVAYGALLFALVSLFANIGVESASPAETLMKVRRFPADTPIDPAAENPDPKSVLVQEGFESSELAIRVGKYVQNTDPKYVASGKASLCVECPKGEHNAKSKIDFFPSNPDGKGEDEVHIRAYFFFPKDFQIAPCGELKLFGCMATRGPGSDQKESGAGVRVDGTDSFTCRVVVGRDDTLRFYTYHPLQKGRYGDHVPIGVKIARDRWYCIELQLRANTVIKATPELLAEKPDYRKSVRGDYVALSDGMARCWVDGRLRAELAGIRYRDIPELQIRRCGAFPYFGGAGEKNTSPKDQVFYLDDYVVSRSYIGPNPR